VRGFFRCRRGISVVQGAFPILEAGRPGLTINPSEMN
jgi:hypothetical protein